jgi:hypothetical protein
MVPRHHVMFMAGHIHIHIGSLNGTDSQNSSKSGKRANHGDLLYCVLHLRAIPAVSGRWSKIRDNPQRTANIQPIRKM